ncbi:MAG: MFS transporter [Pseudomonadota bacterium]
MPRTAPAGEGGARNASAKPHPAFAPRAQRGRFAAGLVSAMARLAGFESVAHALSNRNFFIYAAGSAVSLIGTWMQRVGVGWLAWELTESAFWLGAVAFAELAPSVVVAPIAGVVADRWNRLSLSKATQGTALIQAVVLFGLAASGHMTIGRLLLLNAALGIITAFNQPVRLALMPSLVRHEDLPAAVAITSIIFNSARFIGPAAAGVVIVGNGLAAVFALNAVSFLAFLFALSRIRLPAGEPRLGGGPDFIREIADGYRYAAGHPGIAPILVLMLVVNVCAQPFVELLPAFAAEVFSRGADGFAVLTSAIGVGALAGGVWLARRGHAPGLVRIALANVAGLAGALLLFLWTDRLWPAAGALAVVGFCLVSGNIGAQTLLQLSVEASMRGRVMSLYGMIIRGGPAAGALVMGSLSAAVGLAWPVAGGALITGLAALIAWRRRRALEAAVEPARQPL